MKAEEGNNFEIKEEENADLRIKKQRSKDEDLIPAILMNRSVTPEFAKVPYGSIGFSEVYGKDLIVRCNSLDHLEGPVVLR